MVELHADCPGWESNLGSCSGGPPGTPATVPHGGEDSDSFIRLVRHKRKNLAMKARLVLFGREKWSLWESDTFKTAALSVGGARAEARRLNVGGATLLDYEEMMASRGVMARRKNDTPNKRARGKGNKAGLWMLFVPRRGAGRGITRNNTGKHDRP